jgi:hypothetical protein
MAFVSELGPTLLAALTAIAIAAIGWNRLRIGSIVVLVWATAAIALAQFPLFAGVSDWHEGEVRGFLIFGTFAFMPAALLLHRRSTNDGTTEPVRDAPRRSRGRFRRPIGAGHGEIPDHPTPRCHEVGSHPQ